MSSEKTERLLNLVICLLSTRRPLTKSQIRQAVPQYAANHSVEAFDRMFERDKDELRDLGIPLVTTSGDVLFDDEISYLVDRDAYALPEVHLEPDEVAVLGLASRVWQHASLAGPAARALTKLSSLGSPPDDSSLIGLEPRVRTAEPAFDALWAAARDRSPVRFTYRAASSGAVTVRTVEPWAVTNWHDRWYLTGLDRDRGAPRVFRLSRVDGEVRRIGTAGQYAVPADHRPVAMISQVDGDSPGGTARLRMRRGAGQVFRLRAAGDGPSAPEPAEEHPGWDRMDLHFDDLETLAQEIVDHGAAVIVESPAQLRESVVRRLRAVLDQADPATHRAEQAGLR